MRIRNKPGAIDFLTANPLVEFHPEEYKGKWKRRLQKERICVEIGSGKGDFCMHMAENHPNEGWIAIEKDKNVSVTAIRKTENRSFSNLVWILGDAEHLDEIFCENEISCIYLNFSDPWPKKRYHKRRLTHYRFLETYDKILVESGRVILKTDNQELFEYSLRQFSLAHWVLCELTLDYKNPNNEEDGYTEYERKFVQEGKRIYRASWRKGLHEE